MNIKLSNIIRLSTKYRGAYLVYKKKINLIKKEMVKKERLDSHGRNFYHLALWLGKYDRKWAEIINMCPLKVHQLRNWMNLGWKSPTYRFCRPYKGTNIMLFTVAPSDDLQETKPGAPVSWYSDHSYVVYTVTLNCFGDRIYMWATFSN